MRAGVAQRGRAVAVAAALLALAGCDDKPDVVPAPEGGVAPANLGGPLQVDYACTDPRGGKSHVRVAYGISGVGVPNVVSDARGKYAQLTKIDDSPAMPGTRYAADDAWTKGRRALLVARDQALTIAEGPISDAGSAATVLATCVVTAPKGD